MDTRTPTPSSPASMVGVKLGSYRLLRPLGRGGMGVVYEARDEALRRTVAIKLLPRSMSSDPGALARFQIEARAAARLNHRNVVSIFDVRRDDDQDYIVMELVAGTSAEELVKTRGPLPWLEATRIAASIARGLVAAHEAGLIHRDLKPANVICTSPGTDDVSAKLADFGLAKSLESKDGITRANDVLGTPHYMSPEQCRAEPLDERTDIYSLGATYYTLLTAKVPYGGASPLEVMFAQVSNPVPDPRAVDPKVPAPCAEIVVRAMAKEPFDRYPDAKSLLAELEATIAKHPGARANAPSEEAERVRVDELLATARRPAPPRKHAFLKVGLVLSGSALATGVLLGFTVPSSEPDPVPARTPTPRLATPTAPAERPRVAVETPRAPRATAAATPEPGFEVGPR